MNTTHPFCSKLRSKKSYFLDSPPKTVGDILDGSGQCWCLDTAQAVGPDGDVVMPESCQRDRDCFVPLISS